MVLRVVPDVYRLVQPLGVFDYVTNDDDVVTKVPDAVPKGTDALRMGDQVRIDRIQPFDRKPGIARIGFTEQNYDRRLPIERKGTERVVYLKATAESVASRAVILLRILLYAAAVGFGALLLIINPRLATFAFFVFCLGGAEPTTFTDVLFDPPWREIPSWIGDTISGQASLALLLFALCLAVDSHRGRVMIGAVLGAAALSLGTVHAYDFWPGGTAISTLRWRRWRTCSPRSRSPSRSCARAAPSGNEPVGSSLRLRSPARGAFSPSTFSRCI
jgi:hypothetical protein